MEVANWLREDYAHVVARADVCTDTTDDDAFALLTALTEGLDERLTRTDYKQTKAGQTAATLYLGAPTSEAMSRIYEEGKESPDDYVAATVRTEMQIRPKKPARREWVAQASPAEVFAYTSWSRKLAALIGLAEASAPPSRSARVTDLEGALRTMTLQYGNRLLELADLLGGDVAQVGLELLLRAENDGRLP